MLRVLLLLLLLIRKQGCSPRPHRVLPDEDAGDRRAEAIKRLLELFGLEDPPRSPHHFKQPPQYMVDLYNTVADADGVTKNPDILEGNTVRSFLDKSKTPGNLCLCSYLLRVLGCNFPVP